MELLSIHWEASIDPLFDMLLWTHDPIIYSDPTLPHSTPIIGEEPLVTSKVHKPSRIILGNGPLDLYTLV